MFQLEPPKSQLWLESGELSKQQWEKIQKRTRDHPFNHAVEVFIPGLAELPSDLRTLCPPTYYSSQLHLSQFIQPRLCERLVSQSLTALTVDVRVDTDNVYALLPSGKLFLSVDKDTYEQLGLVGKPSHFQKQHRYLVEVDLTAAHFRAGKPNYDRVKWSLEERLAGESRFLLCHSPTGDVIDRDVLARCHDCHVDTQALHNFQLPTLNCHLPCGENMKGCRATDFHTWLGALACGVDISGETPSDYVSTYKTPEPHTACRHGIRTRWTGMVHSDWVCDLLHKARSVLECDTEIAVAWIAVSVWGFEDSPISWNGCEHGSFMWGDNHYVVVLFREGLYWTVTSLGSHDIMY